MIGIDLDPLIAKFVGDTPFVPDEVRRRYDHERDFRLETGQRKAYVAAAATQYAANPLNEPEIVRDAVFDRVDFTIIGGGFGGLVSGAKMRTAGFDSIRIIESGGDFGGTWYWNRYPGIQCDIESYIYMPLLEELNYMPSQRYATGAEIYQHCRNIASHYRLYDRALLQTAMTRAEWNEDEAVWTISTNRGDRFESKYVISGTGAAHRIKLPAIPGLKSFKGHSFHTSRWDFDYTGGSSAGGLAKLHDKRVAVVGTGATAVQVIPHIAEAAKHLLVFQRTPSSIDVRNNAPTDPDWAASLKPGWQRERQLNFNMLVASGGHQDEDMVRDAWTDIARRLFGPDMAALQQELGRKLTEGEFLQLSEILDMQKMDQIRRRVDEIVHDKNTADALKPWYRRLCKRPCFHDGYLDVFNRPNVSLIDTRGQGVEAMSENGVIVGGEEYPVDCVIFATGFEIGSEYRRGPGKDIIGRDGLTLDEHWANGLRTLHGVISDRFPNMFFIGFTQGSFTSSFPHTLLHQVDHIAYIVSEAEAQGAHSIEPSSEAVNEFVATIRQSAGVMDKLFMECTPGYYNGEGDIKNGAFYEVYRGGSIQFFQKLGEWRDQGDMKGIILS